MRIIHVSDCYAPRTGGIESQVRDLARAQAAAGDEVHVLTATAGADGHGGVEDDGGVAVHRLGARMPFDLPVNPAAAPQVRRLLADLAPDAVHVHAGVVSPFAFDGARVAVDAGAPVAITWHCMLDGVVPVMRAAVRRSGWATAPVALSAVSSAAAQRVSSVFGREVAVVPDGVDLSTWQPDDRRAAPVDVDGDDDGEGARTRPLRAVATMRLAPRKRGPALVDLAADAAARLPAGALRLDVVGDGPARAAVERRVRRRSAAGLDVRLHGRLPREDLRALYAEADVFVAPAALEAFGIAALEARACGLVVVARRGTGVEEFVTHDVDGFLVEDDDAMTDALVRLVADPALRSRLAATARSRRPPFGWERTVAAAGAE
ncbi:glycosyltransferase family 4 protein, partial [Actinotalea sp. AC32]|nr:glycosyltransferase family 4 protein [Actinotalea sp. AC32]